MLMVADGEGAKKLLDLKLLEQVAMKKQNLLQKSFKLTFS